MCQGLGAVHAQGLHFGCCVFQSHGRFGAGQEDAAGTIGLHLHNRLRQQQAGLLLAKAIVQMQADGASGILLACTEAPMALEHAAPEVQALCVDSTEALAHATVALWQQLQSNALKDLRHV